MPRQYVPDRGDIVWLEFTPKTGREQAGRRPALVISPKQYNRKVGLALFCPITSRIKSYPFEVELAFGGRTGAVLSDQIKSLDWRARNASRLARAPRDVMTTVLQKIQTLVSEDVA